MDKHPRETLEAWLQKMDITLGDAQWAQLEAYGNDVLEYNRKVNITADTGDALFLRHMADGLAAAAILRRFFPSGPVRLMDLGAGAGFIGISLKIAWPEASMTLMESSWRKFQFLNWTSARLKLANTRVAWERAVKRPRKAEPLFDAVLARAVAPLPRLLPLAAPFVEPDRGFLAVFQTAPGGPTPGPGGGTSFSLSCSEPEIGKALKAANARLREAVPYRRPTESYDRILALFQYGPRADSAQRRTR